MTDYAYLESLSDSITVLCVKNGSSASNFTDLKEYKAVRSNGIVFTISDDIGYDRHIIPNEPSPHLMKQYKDAFSSVLGVGQKSVGIFEVVI